jgi:hypothetical protein
MSGYFTWTGKVITGAKMMLIEAICDRYHRRPSAPGILTRTTSRVAGMKGPLVTTRTKIPRYIESYRTIIMDTIGVPDFCKTKKTKHHQENK